MATRRCRWRAAASAPHNALDQEHPPGRREVAEHRPQGPTPNAAIVIDPDLANLFHAYSGSRRRRPTVTGKGKTPTATPKSCERARGRRSPAGAPGNPAGEEEASHLQKPLRLRLLLSDASGWPRKKTCAGIHSNLYIFVLGLLMSQYTLTGYDASAHMTEETKNADRNGPIGIISAIGISIVVGWGYILGITFAVKDVPYLLSPDNDAGGYAIAQVFYQAFKSRYGSGVGGIVCLGIVAVAIYFCGMSSVTSNSRMAYAFSRDGAMPLSSVWHKVNKHEVPINAVWLSAFISLCMALPSLGSLVAFQAMVSIATIGLYIAYALPIFFRVTLARKYFVPGPFNLGRYGVVVGWVAVLWVVTITVLFSLPVTYPVTKDTLNYTPVAVGGLFILVLASWIFSARHWFKGPVTNLGG